MLILPRVCADFHSPDGEILFSVRRDMLGCIIEAPESICQDLLFQMLIDEGSLKAVTPAEKRTLENDPMAGVAADGTCAADAAAAAETKSRGKKSAAEKQS